MFMALPIKLAVTGLVFDGEVVVAYEGARRRVHLCVLDDLDPYGPASDRRNRPERRSSSAASTPPEVAEDDADEDGEGERGGDGRNEIFARWGEGREARAVRSENGRVNGK